MLLVKVAPVADSEGLVRDWVVDGTPDIDDANATLQKTFSIRAEVAVDSGDGGVEGLVDVDAFLPEILLGQLHHSMSDLTLTTGPRMTLPPV